MKDFKESDDFLGLKKFDQSLKDLDRSFTKSFSTPKEKKQHKSKAKQNKDYLGLKKVDSDLQQTIKVVENTASDVKKIASVIYKLVNPNALPKDHNELIALEKEMVKAEALRIRAKRARENIINMRKEAKARKKYAKRMQRIEREIKIKRIIRIVKNPKELFRKSEIDQDRDWVY